MCMSKGMPKKPAYGPCNETHGRTVASTYAPPTYLGFGYTSSTTNNTSAADDSSWTMGITTGSSYTLRIY